MMIETTEKTLPVGKLYFVVAYNNAKAKTVSLFTDPSWKATIASFRPVGEIQYNIEPVILLDIAEFKTTSGSHIGTSFKLLTTGGQVGWWCRSDTHKAHIEYDHGTGKRRKVGYELVRATQP